MTEISDHFPLDVPLDDASWACREAVAPMDWYLESIEPHRFVLKKGVRFGTGSLSRIEILLAETGPSTTSVTLNGRSPAGFGRWDKRTLRSLMNTVQNAIEVAARRSSKHR